MSSSLRDALLLVEEIGLWENVREQDCHPGTPLGHAYEQGWNAALAEVLGRLRLRVPPEVDGGAE